MKPEVSVVPERPKVIVPPRPKFSRAKRAAIFLAHGGRCGICKLKIQGDDYDIEHRIPREISANDEDGNLYPAHRGCHAAKTSDDRQDIAKVHRVAGETGQYAKRKRRGGGSIKSRGFGPQSKKMNGSIGPTQSEKRKNGEPS